MKSTEKERLIKSDILSIENQVRHAFNQGYDLGYKDGLQKNIKALQSVNLQEPKIGHWIMSDDELYRPICNNCGAHPWKGYIPTVEEATEAFKYCPNCGAKMVEPQKRSGAE